MYQHESLACVQSTVYPYLTPLDTFTTEWKRGHSFDAPSVSASGNGVVFISRFRVAGWQCDLAVRHPVDSLTVRPCSPPEKGASSLHVPGFGFAADRLKHPKQRRPLISAGFNSSVRSTPYVVRTVYTFSPQTQ